MPDWLFNLWPFRKYRQVTCSDGTRLRVATRAKYAFPLTTADQKGALKAELNAVDQASGAFSAESQRELRSFLWELDAANRSMFVKFRSAYELYQTDPCHHRDYLKDRFDRIMAAEERHRELLLELARLRALGANGWNEEMLKTYLERSWSKVESPRANLREELRAVDKRTEDWKKDG